MDKFVKIILLLFAALAFGYVFSIFFSHLSFTDPQMTLEKGQYIKLRVEQPLTETFVASRENLVKIEFLLRNEGIDEGDTVKMQLADEACDSTLQEGSLVRSTYLSSDNLFEFDFEKIPDSKGKIFCVKLTFESPDPQAEPIVFFSQKNNPSMFSIRPAFENDHWWQSIGELNQRISQYKPWFLKHYYLYALVTLFLVLSAAIVIILIVI